MVEESLELAKKYNANLEIVELGALLHDIALIKKVGTRQEHHINGKILGKEILEKREFKMVINTYYYQFFVDINYIL